MVTSLLTPPPPAVAESRFVLDDVSWDLYEQLRRETDEAHSHVRISYDDGRMVLMSPLPKHDWTKKLIGRMVETALMEWNIPARCFGSTTWKRRDLAKGLEADECYYIQHQAQVRGLDLDLSRDPPPDLVVEVDITNSSRDREPIYAALGVNEIWRYDGDRTAFLKLGSDGRYHPIERSEALPRLTSAIIDQYLALFETTEETSVIRAFAQWLRSKTD